jgi:site-specific DNA recombinase
MYDRFLTGESLSSLARWLNEHGLTTPMGKPFRFQTVREILVNPRNAALRGMRDVVDHKSGTRAQWHRIVGPAVWPAVVSEETWRAAIERIKDPGRPGAHVGSSAQRYLLTGIALCGAEVEPGKLCERPLVTGGRRDERRLRCPTLRHVARRADYIEAYVEEVLLEWFRREDTPKLAAEKPEAAEVDLSAVRSESIELRSRLEGLARDYADGVLDRAQVKSAGDRMRARLGELDEIVARAGEVDVLAPLRAAEDPATVWDEEYTMPTRREVVRRVMTVHVLSGKPGRPGGLRFQADSVRISWRQ